MDLLERLLSEIKHGLPLGWETLAPEQQLHFLLISADDVLKPQGDYILLDASLTMRELLASDSDQSKKR